MVCQECGKKPATLHFTKIVNGEKTEFHICESCAREKGDFIPGTTNGFSIHNLLSGLLDFEPSNKSSREVPRVRLLAARNVVLRTRSSARLDVSAVALVINISRVVWIHC